MFQYIHDANYIVINQKINLSDLQAKFENLEKDFGKKFQAMTLVKDNNSELEPQGVVVIFSKMNLNQFQMFRLLSKMTPWNGMHQLYQWTIISTPL